MSRFSLFGFLFSSLFMAADDNAAGGGKGGDAGDKKPTFSQDHIDAIVKERLARQAEKFSDYEDLKKFRTEHETKLKQAEQKDLEEKRKYDEAKSVLAEREKTLQKIIDDQKAQMNNMIIDAGLRDVVMQNNAFPEAVDILRSRVELKDGNVVMKGKDQYGNDALIAIGDGAKNFFKEKPYLIKAASNGAGAGSGGNAGQGANGVQGANGQGGNDLGELNKQLYDAQKRGDIKAATELRGKIKQVFSSRGINRNPA
jgi:hypothetical protein